jgi:hypothetical protein
VDELATGTKGVHARTAERLGPGFTAPYVRKRISRCRERGLLTATTERQAGGALTPLALTALSVGRTPDQHDHAAPAPLRSVAVICSHPSDASSERPAHVPLDGRDGRACIRARADSGVGTRLTDRGGHLLGSCHARHEPDDSILISRRRPLPNVYLPARSCTHLDHARSG